MDTRKIPVFCYWNGCIKDGLDGPFYEGSSPRVIRVESKIKLSQLLDDLHRVTGLEKGKFQIDLIGRYPSIVHQSMVKYIRLLIVDDCSLETILEVPSYHPSINNVEFYLEVKPVSEPLSHPLPVASSVSSSTNQAARKRFRTDDANVDAVVNVSVRDNTLKTPREPNNNGWIEDEESTDSGNCGSDGNNEAVPKNANLEKSGPTNVLSSSVSKQLFFSSSWLDERELHLGMLFSDKDELDKAVKLYSCRRQRGYFTQERSYSIDFRRSYGCYKCGWVLEAEKTKGNFFEITKYKGPHTCEPEDVGSDFLAGEIEFLIRAQPLLSVSELNKWVKEEFGYTVSVDKMLDAKKKATIAISGDLEKNFSVLPKFMAALCLSNKMVLDWQCDMLPDSEDASSFKSVFWAFQQSIEGFPLCRPLIIVDTVDLSGKYPGKLLVAAGLDADNSLFPLAFAIVTQESLSADTWRWFFGCIRKKVTQREGLCLITSLSPYIVTAVKEPECQWARHRFCIRHMCFKFYEVFSNNLMTEFVYKAGSTSYTSTFNYYLKKIEEMNPEARKWLDEIPPHQWALSHDSDGLRFGIMDTNIIFTTYGFVNKDRDLPITICISLIFDHLEELFKSRRGLLSKSLNREELYAKHVMKRLEEYKLAGRKLDVLPLDQTGESFKVTKVMEVGYKSFFVHRSDQACTCGVWQLYKYPCPHLLAACRRLNIDHLQYVNDFYNTESSLGVYAADFNPLPGVSDWPEVSDAPRLFPPRSRMIH